ncbi:MAG: cysteine desulfurase [Alphaproteobacteria bacterium]|jgi:cysteine desulfurase
MSVYLDNNGTTPLKNYVKEVALKSIDIFGNPSSAHSEGQKARTAIDHARRLVADAMHVRSEQVVFTASGTESNVMALKGIISLCPHKRLITSPTEHSSVYNTAKALEAEGVEVIYLPVNKAGVICLETLERELKAKPTSLVSIMAANNETGVKQPIEEIATLAKAYNAKCHIDAVQILAKEDINFPHMNVDSISISFHKVGGPKGCAALILKNELKMSPLIIGGGQERYRRSGTENVLGIITSGAACEKVKQSIEDMPRLEALRKTLEDGIKKITPDAIIVGEEAQRLPVTTAAIIPDTSAETILMSMDMAGICISQGSACSSGKSVPSRILTVQGYTNEEALAGLRISMAWHNTASDVDAFLKAFETTIKRLR